MPSLIIVPLVLFVKYGTTRLNVNLLDASSSYPEPVPDHGMWHWLVSYLATQCVALWICIAGSLQRIVLSWFFNFRRCHNCVEMVFFDTAEGSSGVKPLSYEDEQLTRVFYEQKIQEVCAAFKFPHKIQVKDPSFKIETLWAYDLAAHGLLIAFQASAIVYFKRFYLQWSVMEHQPKHIM